MNHSNLNFNFINAQLALAAQHPAFFGHYSGHPSMSPLHALKGNNGSNSLPSSSSNNRFAPYNLPSGLGSAFDAVTPSKSAPRSLSTSPRPQSSWWVILYTFDFIFHIWIDVRVNHWSPENPVTGSKSVIETNPNAFFLHSFFLSSFHYKIKQYKFSAITITWTKNQINPKFTIRIEKYGKNGEWFGCSRQIE